MPEIPILGQAATVAFWYPTTIVLCNCREKVKTMLVLTGFENYTKCPHCGKMYANQHIGAQVSGIMGGEIPVTNVNGLMSIKVIVPTPAAEVM